MNLYDANLISNSWYWCLWNNYSSPSRLSFECLDVAPLISELAQGSATAGYKGECLFHRPVALDSRMSMTLDVRGDRGSPTRTTCRMSIDLTDAGIDLHTLKSKLGIDSRDTGCEVDTDRTSQHTHTRADMIHKRTPVSHVIHVRVLLSFHQPTCRKFIKHQWMFSCTCSCLICFKWKSETQVVGMTVRPPYELYLLYLSDAGFLQKLQMMWRINIRSAPRPLAPPTRAQALNGMRCIIS